VDPRAGLEDVEKGTFLILPGFELRPLGRPARSQSLYRLCYAGSMTHGPTITNSKMLFAHSGALSKLLKFIVHLSEYVLSSKVLISRTSRYTYISHVLTSVTSFSRDEASVSRVKMFVQTFPQTRQ
jgi:hypothetical protein